MSGWVGEWGPLSTYKGTFRLPPPTPIQLNASYRESAIAAHATIAMVTYDVAFLSDP